MSITEQEFLDKVILFQQNGKNFKKWESVQKYSRLAAEYALYKGLRKSAKSIACVFMCLIAYAIYWSDVPGFLRDNDCLLPPLYLLQDIFRPVQQDCGFCKIEDIHVRTNLSEEEFFETYAYTGLPLLVADGMRDWDTDKFGYQYFKDLYSKTNLDDNDDDQFFNCRTNITSLFDLFSMSKDRAEFKKGTEPWYIGWSNCVPEVSNELRKDYKVPYFLGYSERTKLDRMTMGSPGYKGASLHMDYNMDYSSWQAQIKGRKKWTFAPPPECWYECPHSHKIVVEPGNIFVFDSSRWYHSTEVLEGEYCLTIGAEYD